MYICIKIEGVISTNRGTTPGPRSTNSERTGWIRRATMDIDDRARHLEGTSTRAIRGASNARPFERRSTRSVRSNDRDRSGTDRKGSLIGYRARNAMGSVGKKSNKRVKCQRDSILPTKEQTHPISGSEIALFARVPLNERNLIHRNDVGL